MPEVITECACGQLEPAAFYGACGVEGCTDCRPLFDADNKPIPGTDIEGPLDRLGRPCEACGAEPGEECRPMCIGQAAHQDETGQDVTA